MSENNGKRQAHKLYLKVPPHCTVEILKRHNHYGLTAQKSCIFKFLWGSV